jgi:hypothetical protein
MTDGGVYFLEAPSLELIKIGTSVDVIGRIAGLRLILPVETELLKVIPGGQAEEFTLHRKFAAQRVRGEWFRARAVKEALNEYDSLAVDISPLLCCDCGSWARVDKRKRCPDCDLQENRPGATITGTEAAAKLGIPHYLVYELWRRGAFTIPSHHPIELQLREVERLRRTDGVQRALARPLQYCGATTAAGGVCRVPVGAGGKLCRTHHAAELRQCAKAGA